MRIPGLKTARKKILWLKNKILPGAIILGYHRVATVQDDIFYNCVSPEHFDQQMAIIRKYANPISLINLVERIQFNKPLPKTVCVTIDDGYADALYTAKPILEKYEIPATVFVTTGNLGGEFWWDELERYLSNASSESSPLRLNVGDRDFEWNFKDLDSAGSNHHILEIADLLRPLNAKDQRKIMDQIKAWLGNDDPERLPSARSMTPNELVSVSDGGLIHIGSHSISHPILSALSKQQRDYEIGGSKQFLEEILAKPVLGFSYPNGSFTPSDPKLVARDGYLFACGSNNGTVRSNISRFTLPRFWPKDCDGNSFLTWLKGWI